MPAERKNFKPNTVSLIVILFASMMILMGAAAVAPALKPISIAFPDASAYMVSLIVTLPALGVAAAGFGVGYLADRFGKVKVLISALIIFTVAGISGYFLDSIETILIGRFILGIGIAGISIATTALIAEYYTGAERAKIIGYQSAAMGVGILLLEVFGGALADVDWRVPFLIYLIGIPILIGAIFSIREPTMVSKNTVQNRTDTKADRKGVLLCYLMIFLAMLIMFVLPTTLPYHITDMGSNLLICGLMLGIMGTAQATFSILYSRTSNKLSDNKAYALSTFMLGVGFMLLYINSLVAVVPAMICIGAGMGLITLTVIGKLSFYSQNGNTGNIMGGYSVAINIGIFMSSLIVVPIVSVVGSYNSAYVILGAFALIICAIYVSFILIKRKNTDVRMR